MGQGQFRVTLLGTGTPVPLIERFGPSTLVEVGDIKLVFDCGRGAIQRLHQLGIPLAEVSSLFLTHLHSDHLVGLPDLWLTGWIFGRAVPFRVWGPAGTQSMMSHLEQAFQEDIHIRRDLDEGFPAEGILVETSEIEQGVIFDEAEVKVTAFDVDHRPVKPAFGYRIDFNGKSVVLSGDTRLSENLVRFSENVDLLIHEVVGPEAVLARSRLIGRDPQVAQRIIDHHTTPAQAGEIFTRVQPRLAVYSHIVGGPNADEEIISGTRETYSGKFVLGEDLMAFEVGEEVQMVRPSGD